MITYRHQKGTPLTNGEVDENFHDLDKRLQKLEETCGQEQGRGEGIGHIIQEGDSLQIIGTYGTVFGTFTLPKVFPTPRGDWKPKTAYRGQDWVHYETHVYACRLAHTSEENFTDKHWEKIL